MEQITWKNFEKFELRAGSEVLTTGFYLPAGRSSFAAFEKETARWRETRVISR
jgi:hypothetical protein